MQASHVEEVMSQCSECQSSTGESPAPVLDTSASNMQSVEYSDDIPCLPSDLEMGLLPVEDIEQLLDSMDPQPLQSPDIAQMLTNPNELGADLHSQGYWGAHAAPARIAHASCHNIYGRQGVCTMFPDEEAFIAELMKSPDYECGAIL